jgi:hypothetical protein
MLAWGLMSSAYLLHMLKRQFRTRVPKKIKRAYVGGAGHPLATDWMSFPDAWSKQKSRLEAFWGLF